MLTSFSMLIVTYILAILGMSFFTLLERKALGYFQIRKGPNKVGIAGIPQPFADALKLFTKELNKPTLANQSPFLAAPTLGLFLALVLWSLYPCSNPSFFVPFGILLFLCVSSFNVYSTLISGWASNSKYALLGALRTIAQTISYEVSMSLILLSVLLSMMSMDFTSMYTNKPVPYILMFLIMFFIWFTTTLAETNRTPFDLSEGESELVSGFNVEFSSGTFALIFMAEYLNILIMSLFTTILFLNFHLFNWALTDIMFTLKISFIAFTFVWVRATLPRMRYDMLMNLTWKTFLPFSLGMLMLMLPLITIMT
uniref:NADH-ubiquinone oxidoreductase chain 1 n=1 Tax=Glycera cf. tridactyla FS20 TaxID=1763830 RepID=A0A0S3CR10_9ANNE|nr:NADH dehydrogenase subunit 1 [Glycera cf. tridactyla FS20]